VKTVHVRQRDAAGQVLVLTLQDETDFY